MMAKSAGAEEPIAEVDLLKPTKFTRMASATLRSGVLPAGAVLGQVLRVTSMVPGESNAGNGRVESVQLGVGARAGRYMLVCIEQTPSGGAFKLDDPNGRLVAVAKVGQRSAGPLLLSIARGSKGFAVGDRFAVDVVTTIENDMQLARTMATDGSQTPIAILAQDADASSGPVRCQVFTRGHFRADALTIGEGHSVGSIAKALLFCEIVLH